MSSGRDPASVRAVDLFCGAGGSSWGAHLAGVTIAAGIDIDPIAVATYSQNFPDAIKMAPEPAETVDLAKLREQTGEVDLLLASPECTDHTHAKGNAPRSEASREKALQVIRYAEVFESRWVVVENVVNMQSWSGYSKFIAALKSLGYHVSEQKLNSADFGVPQSRRRLFLICDKEAPPSPVLLTTRPTRRTAKSVVDLGDKYGFTPLVTERRAQATLERAGRARAALGDDVPFLLVYYGTDKAGGWQRIDAPLRTITTIDRFAVVKWEGGQPFMRMLQPDELRKAMGFVRDSAKRPFRLDHGTRRDRVRLLGNAVCPPVMQAIVGNLISARDGEA